MPYIQNQNGVGKIMSGNKKKKNKHMAASPAKTWREKINALRARKSKWHQSM